MVHRRRRSSRFSGQMKRYFQGFLFIIIIPLITNLLVYAISLMPDMEPPLVLPGNITLGWDELTSFLYLIVLVASLVMIISALARLGVRI